MSEKSGLLCMLPVELLETILAFLQPRDLGSLEICSKFFREFIKREIFWKRKAELLVREALCKIDVELKKTQEAKIDMEDDFFMRRCLQRKEHCLEEKREELEELLVGGRWKALVMMMVRDGDTDQILDFY